MFRIGSQPPQITPVSTSTTAQGGTPASNPLQSALTALDAAIAALQTQQGGAHPAGGDSLELPGGSTHFGGPNAMGVGMPGGTIATLGIAHGPGLPGGTVGTFTPEHTGGVHKGGLAGGTIGTQKSGMPGGTVATEKNGPGTHHSPFSHRPAHHHRPFGHKPALEPTVGHSGPLFSGSPGGTIGTRTAGSQLAVSDKFAPAPAPAPAATAPAPTAPTATAPTAPTRAEDLANVLTVNGGGGGGAIAVDSKDQLLGSKGGGGLAGGVIATNL